MKAIAIVTTIFFPATFVAVSTFPIFAQLTPITNPTAFRHL